VSSRKRKERSSTKRADKIRDFGLPGFGVTHHFHHILLPGQLPTRARAATWTILAAGAFEVRVFVLAIWVIPQIGRLGYPIHPFA
jgi:hypothetical protein